MKENYVVFVRSSSNRSTNAVLRYEWVYYKCSRRPPRPTKSRGFRRSYLGSGVNRTNEYCCRCRVRTFARLNLDDIISLHRLLFKFCLKAIGAVCSDGIKTDAELKMVIPRLLRLLSVTTWRRRPTTVRPVPILPKPGTSSTGLASISPDISSDERNITRQMMEYFPGRECASFAEFECKLREFQRGTGTFYARRHSLSATKYEKNVGEVLPPSVGYAFMVYKCVHALNGTRIKRDFATTCNIHMTCVGAKHTVTLGNETTNRVESADRHIKWKLTESSSMLTCVQAIINRNEQLEAKYRRLAGQSIDTTITLTGSSSETPGNSINSLNRERVHLFGWDNSSASSVYCCISDNLHAGLACYVSGVHILARMLRRFCEDFRGLSEAEKVIAINENGSTSVSLSCFLIHNEGFNRLTAASSKLKTTPPGHGRVLLQSAGGKVVHASRPVTWAFSRQTNQASSSYRSREQLATALVFHGRSQSANQLIGLIKPPYKAKSVRSRDESACADNQFSVFHLRVISSTSLALGYRIRAFQLIKVKTGERMFDFAVFASTLEYIRQLDVQSVYTHQPPTRKIEDFQRGGRPDSSRTSIDCLGATGFMYAWNSEELICSMNCCEIHLDTSAAFWCNSIAFGRVQQKLPLEEHALYRTLRVDTDRYEGEHQRELRYVLFQYDSVSVHPAYLTNKFKQESNLTNVRGSGLPDEPQKARPRDAGWAWLVMFASFTLQLFIDGSISGFGVIFLAIQQDEAFVRANYTRTLLAMPGSIQPGFFLCTGAFASPFIQKFGFRLTGSFASIMVSSGISLSSMQTNIHLFSLFYGVVAGIGFGILMVCAIVSVNFYFERFRGISSGVAMAGAGVGYLTVPLLFSKMVERLGWRNALLSYSVSIFPVMLLSVLTFRPFILDSNESESEEEIHEASLPLTGTTPSVQPSLITPAPNSLQQSDNHPAHTYAHNASLHVMTAKTATPMGSRCPSDSGRSKSIREETSEPERASTNFANLIRQYLLRHRDPTLNQDLDNAHNDNLDDEFGSTIGSRLWKSTQAFKRRRQSSKSQQAPFLVNTRVIGSGDLQLTYRFHRRARNKRSIMLDPFEQMDIFFSANLSSLGYKDAYVLRRSSEQRSRLSHFQMQEAIHTRPLHESIYSITRSGAQLDNSQQPIHTSHVSFAKLTPTNKRSFIASLSSIKEPAKPSLLHDEQEKAERNEYLGEDPETSVHSTPLVRRFRQRLVALFDLRLFTDSSFLYLLAVGVFNQLAYFIPFVYLVDFAVSKGHERGQAILLIVILGSFHTAGRIVAGCAANLVWMDTVYLSGIGTLAGGICNIVLPLVFPSSFLWYSIYAALFGVACAFPIPMIHLLLVRFLGLERLTASYSNLNLAKGIASVVGPLVAVNIVETTGQTDHYFFVAGVCFALSALAHLGLCRFPCSKPVDELEDDFRADCCMCLTERQQEPQDYIEEDEELHADLPLNYHYLTFQNIFHYLTTNVLVESNREKMYTQRVNFLQRLLDDAPLQFGPFVRFRQLGKFVVKMINTEVLIRAQPH
ncbi:monocarboxylate transporter 14, partial [Clonorchis sinensis]